MKKLVLILLAVLFFSNSFLLAQCGSERWEVKVLEDPEAVDINFTPVRSTVHKQLALEKPNYHDDNPRDITEKKVYLINCILVKYKKEEDKDWHLVVKDLGTDEEMVVEIPDPECVDMSNPRFSKLKVLRERLKAQVGPVTTSFRKPPAGTRIRITGVGFFDKKNHPIGFKGRELHPVLELKVL